MICRAAEIKPYVWQRSFALGQISSLPGKRQRGNGKTTAVILRLLMLPPGLTKRELSKILSCDPDWSGDFTFERRRTYALQYLKLWCRCAASRIPTADYYGYIIDSFRYNN